MEQTKRYIIAIREGGHWVYAKGMNEWRDGPLDFTSDKSEATQLVRLAAERVARTIRTEFEPNSVLIQEVGGIQSAHR